LGLKRGGPGKVEQEGLGPGMGRAWAVEKQGGLEQEQGQEQEDLVLESRTGSCETLLFQTSCT
jgi:hypothetical protein